MVAQNREKIETVRCEHCGQLFMQTRTNRRYCTGTCRYRAHMKRKVNGKTVQFPGNSTRRDGKRLEGKAPAPTRPQAEKKAPPTKTAVPTKRPGRKGGAK